MKTARWDRGYLRASRTATYGLLGIVPLFCIYEILAWFGSRRSMIEARNSIDLWLRSLIESLGLNAQWVLIVCLALALLSALWLREASTTPLRMSYFFLMILEGAAYAAVIGYPLSRLTRSLLSASPLTSSQLMLAFGAGAYEELIFRALFYDVTVRTLRRYYAMPARSAYIAAAVFSSFLFSAFHGEPLSFYNSLYRFFTGVLFCALYSGRGLAVTAWTHTLYDLFLLVA